MLRHLNQVHSHETAKGPVRALCRPRLQEITDVVGDLCRSTISHRVTPSASLPRSSSPDARLFYAGGRQTARIDRIIEHAGAAKATPSVARNSSSAHISTPG